MRSFENIDDSTSNMPNTKSDDDFVPAYHGDKPYIFISYSHSDSHLVRPEIKRFFDDGYRIWYDEGVTSGKRWLEVVETALKNSDLFVFFISKNSIESKYVKNEVSLAMDKDIPILPIYLEETELKYGLELGLKSTPSIFKFELSDEKYIESYRTQFENREYDFKRASPVNERIDNPPFDAYYGDEPYIFVSYSHLDSQKVFDDITKFHDDGYNIWYDAGISTGERWREVIERSLTGSNLFVVFISKNSVESVNVRKEIFCALDNEMTIIPIFLEKTDLKYGLGLELRPLQSIYRFEMSEEGFVKRYRKEFEDNGFDIKEKTPSTDQSIPTTSHGDETEEIIQIIENNISDLNETEQNNFTQLKELYDKASASQNKKLLEHINGKLNLIFDDLFVIHYFEAIKNAPDILDYPSLMLNLQSDSIIYRIIQNAFFKFEMSNDFADLDRANELMAEGHSQIASDDIEGLENTVVQLYNLSNGIMESSHSKKSEALKIDISIDDDSSDEAFLTEFELLNTTTNSIHDLGEYDVLIILKNGDNLTSWDDVSDKEDILYVSEDLSVVTDFTDRYRDLKSLKAIVAINVTCDATNMRGMFSGCSSLEDISCLEDWKTNNVKDMNGMFKGCSSLEDISSLKQWDTHNVTDMNGMFDGCSSLESIFALRSWQTDSLFDISGMFYGCSALVDTFSLEKWDISNVKFMSRTFRGCSSLKEVSALKEWDTSNVRDMKAMFKGCSSLTEIFALKGWKTNNVTDMNELFCDCSSLEDIYSLKSWKTNNVKDMNGMFKGCTSLEDISPLKDWKTNNVNDMSSMFEDCSSLMDILPLKNWDIKKLKDMTCMFHNCSALDDASSLENWNVSNVIYMKDMFDGSGNIKKIPKWYK